LVLTDTERKIWKAITVQVQRVAAIRNPVAHWVWGCSTKLADAVILVDPGDLVGFRLDLADMSSDIGRRVREMRYAKATPPHPPDPLREGARVYRAVDFQNVTNEIRRVMQMVIEFRSLWHWSEGNRGVLWRLDANEELAKDAARAYAALSTKLSGEFRDRMNCDRIGGTPTASPT